MAFSVVAADEAQPEFVAVVSGLDLSDVPGTDTIEQLESVIDQYAVVIFPDQRVNDEQQYAFSACFGEMEKATGDINAMEARRLSMDINDISNLDVSGKVLARDDRARLFSLGNMLWHSDSSFKAIPAKYSLLSARVIPDEGGNTEFADMRAAWRALNSAQQQECIELVCEHSQIYSRGMLGFEDFTAQEREKWRSVSQPLVRRHPVTGEQSLYLSSHIGTIVDWPVPEARLFIKDLTEHATQNQFVYTHKWTQGDLVLWDNRVTMHRARRYDHKAPRDLHRTTVAGDSLLITPGTVY